MSNTKMERKIILKESVDNISTTANFQIRHSNSHGSDRNQIARILIFIHSFTLTTF